MALAIRESARTIQPDVVHLQLVRTAPYMRFVSPSATVLDLLDASELSMRERARAMPWFIRMPLLREAHRLGSYERRVSQLANLSIFISERDRAYAGHGTRSRVNPNGVDVASDLTSVRRLSTIIFSGTMSYFPNADAARWFAYRILPLVRQEFPEARFSIVGRNPTFAVRAAGKSPAVEILGAVPVMADALRRGTVAVCPMRYGSGLQTKILEAMAVATPIVATSKAVEGLPEDLVAFVTVADKVGEFAAAVIRILRDPEIARRRAEDAVAVLRSRHTWHHSVSELEKFYEEAIEINRSVSDARRDARMKPLR